MTIFSRKKCFYVPGSGRIIDLARADGRGVYSGETLAEIRKRYPGARLMDFEDASHAARCDNRVRLCTGPREIPESKFHEMLGCLPPVDWRSDGDTESFKMSERTIDTLTGIFCRIGKKYFTLTEDIRTPHARIVELCRQK